MSSVSSAVEKRISGIGEDFFTAEHAETRRRAIGGFNFIGSPGLSNAETYHNPTKNYPAKSLKLSALSAFSAVSHDSPVSGFGKDFFTAEIAEHAEKGDWRI